MIIKNGKVLDKSFHFVDADVVVKDGKIVKIGKACTCGETEVIDAAGKYVIPGLVDIHTHGCGGVDACNGTKETLDILSTTQGKAGITSFCPTTMTIPEDELLATMKYIGEYKKAGNPAGADVAGIYMEGPFISAKKKGAQREDCVKAPDVAFFDKMNEASGNIIKVVTVAPEAEGSMEFISAVKDRVTISIAHTDCDYACAMDAIHAGASHITHLYNAMNGLTHRAPGVVGAAADTNVATELICDGIHINPAVIRLTFKVMEGRVNLISDSMEATGMPNGEYQLGGQKVFVKDKKATLADGTIAGSSTNLMDCMRNVVKFGIPLPEAVKAATLTPATEIGMQDKIGKIDIGNDADILVLDKDLELETIIMKGKVRTF